MIREPDNITAVEIAKANGIDPPIFRRELRKEGLKWHQHKTPWIVLRGSPQHADMERVMAKLMAGLGIPPKP